MIRQDWSTLKKLMFLKAAAGGGSAAVERYANGNPVVFGTDLARPLKAMQINLLPVQSGSGDPSPQNIRPIVAWDGVKVWNGGKNLLNVSEEGYIAFSWNRFLPNPFKKAGTYKVSCQRQFGGSSEYGCRLCIANVTNTAEIVGNALTAWGFGKGTSLTATVNVTEEQAKGKYLKFEMHSAGATLEGLVNAELQIEAGSTATAYEPYHPITETDISFPSPVYGGEHEAVSGVLQARQYDSVTFKWGDATNRTVIGNVERRGFIVPRQVKSQDDLNADPTARFCSVAPWKYSYSSDDVHYYGGGYSFYVFLPVGTDENLEFQLVVERPLQPQEITLTPEQITAIKGNNTIWSDANGAINLTYLVSGKYAEDHPVGGLGSGLGSGLLGAGTEPEEPIEDPAEEPEE